MLLFKKNHLDKLSKDSRVKRIIRDQKTKKFSACLRGKLSKHDCYKVYTTPAKPGGGRSL